MTSAAIEQTTDSDPYTAPAEDVPSRHKTVSLGDSFRAFWRQPSPPYLFGAVALAVGLRLAQGNHRLHHFKNERYWFGVTSTVGDRVIGTLPDQRSVERSPTARSLRSER